MSSLRDPLMIMIILFIIQIYATGWTRAAAVPPIVVQDIELHTITHTRSDSYRQHLLAERWNQDSLMIH
ncbi:hypothetical protein K466DRAFT_589831 [Polyporus arcularius HHB13444]|uniref:Uncharacterized protein n=1 Tax=Polyporus arcularius HHB13444 TaxID=1314778 RepID=A0A5C3P2V0_9APHY|nr:hypothetical protein K466DRAFT_589831 [Polyporus arcularius HHB13444]